MTSPSERYAAFRRRQAEATRDADSTVAAFAAAYPFALDPFQVDACRAVEDGQSVLVAAPTGSGKTVVGEFGVELAVERGRKVFYTAPIKALSNQKYGDLVDRYGADRVGLLTGDTSVNSEAQIVVMTTEVLRNMLYADSPTLGGLGFVVLDEVHFLGDRYRGAVWEEVILHLPMAVQIIGLSATVSNAEEFGAWLDEVRGSTYVVVSEERPVPLWQHVALGETLQDLFVDEDGRPVAAQGPGSGIEKMIDPDLQRAAATHAVVPADRGHDRTGHRGRAGKARRGGPAGSRGGRGGGGAPHGGRGPQGGRDPRSDDRAGFRPPGRPELLRALDDDGLLPAIFFIFSRNGCDAALRQCAAARLTLTSRAERERARTILDERLSGVPTEDWDILNLTHFRRSAEHGLAAHHAGMLPLLKEIVEELFAEGLIKAVFATETLALGVNMPARSVVLEKLVKFDGTGHVQLSPGEFTQLTGRAGRRGIDTEGHAVTVAGGRFDPEDVAHLASRRTYPLRSSFAPTYNMAVNLLSRLGLDRSRESLEQSFAQFQADRSVVGLARKARELTDTADAYAGAMECDRGDFPEYMTLRRDIADRESELSRERSQRHRARTIAALGELRRGDVIAIPGGRRAGYAVVVDTGKKDQGLDGPTPQVITTQGRMRSYGVSDFTGPPAVVDSVRVPKPGQLHGGKARKDVAAALRSRLSGADDPARAVRSEKTPSTVATDDLLQDLKRRLRDHPCHTCPDREQHARWGARWEKTRSERDRTLSRIEGRTSHVGRAFDRIVAVLEQLGYLAPGEDGTLAPTRAGERLRTVYSEKDLLVAESIRRGLWSALDAPALAAMVCGIVHDSRRDDPLAPDLPDEARFRQAWYATAALHEELTSVERRHRVEPMGGPEPALTTVMHRWARGEHFAAAVEDTDVQAGDFVRTARQVIDLLGQLDRDPEVGSTARRAVDLVRRGIVAQELSA